MDRRALLASLAFTLLAGRAKAGMKEAGQYVDLAQVALPIVANGRLVNYVFIYVRINLTGAADLARLRDKEPYFRDALVRLGYRTPFTLPNDYNQLDAARLKAAFYQAAVAIAGPGMVASIELLSPCDPPTPACPPGPGRAMRRVPPPRPMGPPIVP